MPNTKQDLRQIRSKNKDSKELGLDQNFLLNNLLDNLNLELDFPLKVSASFPIPDSKINFSNSKIINADGSISTVLPIQGQIFTDLASLWIDFQAQTVSNPSDFEITWPTSNTVGYYRIAGFTLTDAGKISIIFSNESTLENNLDNAGEFFVSSGLPIGYIILQCTHADGKFKTSQSASNIIENSKIFRFDSKSGGGGESNGEINSGVNTGSGEGLYKQKVGLDLRFKSISASGNATVSSDLDTVTISTGSVEANTASNVGTGSGVFKQKIGTNLEFKSLLSGASAYITPTADTLIIDIPPGENNTASNVGGGAGIFKQKISNNFEFKTIVAGSGFYANPTSDSIELSGSEANTASNVGTGIGLFKQKNLVDLRFRSLIFQGGLSVVSGSNEITINDTNNPNINYPILGDMVESALTFTAFQASRADGSTWVPLDGRSIVGSDLYNSGNVEPGFLTGGALPVQIDKYIKINN
jgi:hypothetical protein